MTHAPSLPAKYFDELYARDADPWRFASSDYERAKYEATIAALPQAGFASAFEVGCSIGVLTQRLAERCDSLLAVDVAEAALAQARHRCAELSHVTLQRMRIPAEWPEGLFDLIVLSEVLYYLSVQEIEQTAALVRHSIAKGGAILLVHYTLPTDYPNSGDAAAEGFMTQLGLVPTLQQRETQYRLDLLRA
jgi:predicted TPR repeat methyltransferase